MKQPFGGIHGFPLPRRGIRNNCFLSFAKQNQVLLRKTFEKPWYLMPLRGKGKQSSAQRLHGEALPDIAKGDVRQCKI